MAKPVWEYRESETIRLCVGCSERVNCPHYLSFKGKPVRCFYELPFPNAIARAVERER